MQLLVYPHFTVIIPEAESFVQYNRGLLVPLKKGVDIWIAIGLDAAFFTFTLAIVTIDGYFDELTKTAIFLSVGLSKMALIL